MSNEQGESVAVDVENVLVKDENVTVKAENENVAVSAESKNETELPVYKEKDKLLCDFCGKGYAKTGIARHRKKCLSNTTNKESEKETVNTQPAASVLVVPVTTEPDQQPPPPGKLERQPSVKTKANKKGTVKVEEVLNEIVEEAGTSGSCESDEYEKAVEEPATPAAQPPDKTSKTLTRVDKMRMLARSGLPK